MIAKKPRLAGLLSFVLHDCLILCYAHHRFPGGIDLMAVCGPGDMGEPVVTIMMTDED
jgi:hypothetical protein